MTKARPTNQTDVGPLRQTLTAVEIHLQAGRRDAAIRAIDYHFDVLMLDDAIEVIGLSGTVCSYLQQAEIWTVPQLIAALDGIELITGIGPTQKRHIEACLEKRPPCNCRLTTGG